MKKAEKEPAAKYAHVPVGIVQKLDEAVAKNEERLERILTPEEIVSQAASEISDRYGLDETAFGKVFEALVWTVTKLGGVIPDVEDPA